MIDLQLDVELMKEKDDSIVPVINSDFLCSRPMTALLLAASTKLSDMLAFDG